MSFRRDAAVGSAFTLIELLVVIAVIAILSIVVVLVLNPAQLLMQARDSNRLSDMASLNSALGIYLAQGGSALGTSSVVYVSIPDPSATSTLGDQCQGLSLPTLPAAYSYQCAASSTYRSPGGQGWIPVNFSSLPAGSPFSSLPMDPTNTSSSREYYTYETNGSQYEVTMVPEASKDQLGGSNDLISSDGGILASVYEKGSKLGLEPLDYGDPTLVGWWPLTEGTGSIAYDDSGNNATGSWQGTQAGSGGTYYVSGRNSSFPYAGDFDGSTDYISSLNPPIAANNAMSVTAWVRWTGSGSWDTILAGLGGFDELSLYSNTNQIRAFSNGFASSTIGINTNAWAFVAGTFDGINGLMYVNGLPAGSVPSPGQSGGTFQISRDGLGSNYFAGLISDVRIYSRALPAAQIASMYSSGK